MPRRNDNARRLWVEKDEGLGNLWQESGQTLRQWIRGNRKVIDGVMDCVVGRARSSGRRDRATPFCEGALPPSVRLTMVRDKARPQILQQRIGCTRDARAIAAVILEGEPQEVMLALLLDNKHQVIATHEVSRGALDGTIAHPREVFRAAIMFPAASLILAHNHPSGDTTPSVEDLAVTRRLAEAGRILGIPLIDHVIVGDGKTFSLRESGQVPSAFK